MVSAVSCMVAHGSSQHGKCLGLSILAGAMEED